MYRLVYTIKISIQTFQTESTNILMLKIILINLKFIRFNYFQYNFN